MNTDRRSFVRNLSLGGLCLVSSKFPLNIMPEDADLIKLTILHTNDVHSRVEPFPMDGGRNQGKGGVAKRAVLINNIRAKERNVLLLDAGDIFQGTPYFNFYGGEIEMKLMSQLKYDASTIGNHDFDGGIDGLDKQLPNASFPLINSNYDFSNTVLKDKIPPYKIFMVQGLKIGVYGLGIELKGLVPTALYKDTVYNDPLAASAKYCKLLRHELKCDYVICLSHLGYKYEGESSVSDHILAENSEDLDLIIGGHTHTFLQEATHIANKKGLPVAINQAGWAGIMLGRIDVLFERNRKGKCQSCANTSVG